MPVIETTPAPTTTRRPPHEVLGAPPGAGSPYGATYYRRVTRCAREHGLATVARVQPAVTGEALSLGWAYHYALEAYYRALQSWHGSALDGPAAQSMRRRDAAWDRAYADARDAAMRVVDAFEREPGYEDFHATLSRCVACYLDVARSDRWFVLAVEETLGIVRPAPYSARLDLVVAVLGDEPQDDVVWVVEHKTARGIGPSVLSGYQLDLQTLGQAYLWRACVDGSAYPPCLGVRVAITSKARVPQHVRVDAIYSAAHFVAFEASLRAAARTAEVGAQLGFPPNFGSCAGAVRGYGQCPYYQLCFGAPALDVRALDPATLPPGYVVSPPTDATRVDDEEE